MRLLHQWYVWMWAWISFLASSTGSSGRCAPKTSTSSAANSRPRVNLRSRSATSSFRSGPRSPRRYGLAFSPRTRWPGPTCRRHPVSGTRSGRGRPTSAGHSCSTWRSAPGHVCRKFAGLHWWDADLEACEVSIASPPASEEALASGRGRLVSSRRWPASTGSVPCVATRAVRPFRALVVPRHKVMLKRAMPAFAAARLCGAAQLIRPA